tara:strand:+ start:209 stop:1006 length:798 start_codon:yes stop_codon:yes gene_type:complete
MPIYKGSTEVTSGNLYKGSAEVENGYKATSPFFVNEVTLTVNFSLSGNGSLAFSSTTVTGAPGSSFTQITNTITPTSGYYVTGGTSSDDGTTVTSAVYSSGSGSVRVNGTIPSTTSTVNISSTVNTTAFIDINVTAGGNSPWAYTSGVLPSGTNYQAGTGNTFFTLYFNSNAEKNDALNFHNPRGSRQLLSRLFSGSVYIYNEYSAGIVSEPSQTTIRISWNATGPNFETTSAGTLAAGNTSCSVAINRPYRLIGTTSRVDIQGS